MICEKRSPLQFQNVDQVVSGHIPVNSNMLSKALCVVSTFVQAASGAEYGQVSNGRTQ